MEIVLTAGVHEVNASALGELPFVFDSRVVASEVWITAGAAATVRAVASPRLFAVRTGAPRVTFRGLTFNSAIVVAGGEPVIDSCRFDGCETAAGGAMLITGGLLDARNISFVGNTADHGGA